MPYLYGLLTFAEAAIHLKFFYESPFLGSLIPVEFPMMPCWCCDIFRYIYAGLLIPRVTFGIYLDCLTVVGYAFIIGPLSFATYVKGICGRRNEQLYCRNFANMVFNYKQVYLLIDRFNNLFCNRILVRVFFPGLAVPIVCTSTIFMLGNVLNFGLIILLLCLAIAIYASEELFYVLCAHLWKESEKLLDKMNQVNETNRKFSYKKRVLASMVPMRIKLGDSNFVEKCTPLIILSLCIQYTVNILCLRVKHG